MTKTKWVWGLCIWAGLLAVIFLVPLTPLVSNKTVEAPFLLQTGPDRAVVFFGFSACDEVCPMTMMKLSDVLKSGEYDEEWPAVVFVDIDQASNAQQASDYAEGFNSHFQGYFPTPDELSQLRDIFGLNFQQKGDRISHRGRTYVLQRRDRVWYLTNAYNPQGFSAALVKNALF